MAFVNHSEDSRESAIEASAASSSATRQKTSRGARVTYTYDPEGFTTARERTGIPDPRVKAQVFYRSEGGRIIALPDRGEAQAR
jgi:YD repeat-containing protein